MNTNDINPNIDSLDDLFASARSSEPNLVDENFTKIVMNSLPRKPFAQDTQMKGSLRKSFSFDLIGAALGMGSVYFLLDLSSIVSSVVNFIPETIVVSPLHVVGLAAGAIAATVVAWWSVENVKI